VTPTLARRTGGPAVLIVELARALEREGIESTVFTTDMARAPAAWSGERLADGDLPDGADQLDVRVFGLQHPYRLAYSRPLARALRAETRNFDVVHVHSLFLHPQFAGFRAARRAGVPHVVSPHGSLDPYLRRRGRARKALNDLLWQRRMLESAALLHVTSDGEAALISDVAPAVPRAVVPLGIDWRRFQGRGDGARFRARHLGGHDGPVVLFLGRLTFKKGIDILIEAMAEVLRARPDARLAIVGPDDEELEPRLAALAERLGIGHALVFTGMLTGNDRADALAAARLWALSSHTENFGVAVVEAIAAGLPVVISRAVNIAPDLEQANVAVVPELEPEAFARAILRLVEDDREATAMGERAREFARRYDWASVVPRFAELYRRAARLRSDVREQALRQRELPHGAAPPAVDAGWVRQLVVALDA
jgi:glycosyltransferase involved in cell wall biosynthesis